MADQTINPATGTLVRECATITDDELDTVVRDAHEAFRMDWRQRSVPDRASIVAVQRGSCGLMPKSTLNTSPWRWAS